MFRTAVTTLTCSSMSLIRSFVTLRADTSEITDWPEPSKDKVLVTQVFPEEEDELGAKAIDWMAEPLTDLATREANKNSMRVRMEMMIMRVQRELCRALENEENPKYKFQVDRWTRSEGGGGITCVLQDGHTYEKAGVNISVVHGKIPPKAVAQMNDRGKNLPEGKEMPFFACGISSVIHPRNPHIPTIHFNYRYFEVHV